MKNPKISAVQMSSSDNVDDNLKSARYFIKEAKDQGSSLVVLPEMFTLMGKRDTDKLAIKEELHNGKIQTFLSDEAKKNKLWISGGTIPIACADENRIRAATLVFNENGDNVAQYDKMHLFDATISDTESYKESDTTEPGHEVMVIDSPVGKLGLAVCYDIRFPGLFRLMLNKGAEVFAVPAAFTFKTGQAHWELFARARAVENFCYFVGACQTGTHANRRQTYGHSMIVDPWGDIKAQLGFEIGVISTEIDLAFLRTIRRNFGIATL